MNTPDFTAKRRRLREERDDEVRDAEACYAAGDINSAQKNDLKHAAVHSYASGLQDLKDVRDGRQGVTAASTGTLATTRATAEEHSAAVVVKVNSSSREIISNELVDVVGEETFLSLVERVVRKKLGDDAWNAYVGQPLVCRATESAASTNFVAIDTSSLVQSALALRQTFISFTFSAPRPAARPAANAFSLIMRNDQTLPDKYQDPELRQLQFAEAAFNEIVDNLEREGLGVSQFNVALLKELILTVRDVVALLKGRKNCPESKFPERFQLKATRTKAKAQTDEEKISERLKDLQNRLGHRASRAIFLSAPLWKPFKDDVESLQRVLSAEVDRLADDNARSLQNHRRVESIDTITATTVEQSRRGTAPKYAAIERRLRTLGDYNPLLLGPHDIDEYDPPNANETDTARRQRRRRFRNEMEFLIVAFKKYTHNPGGPAPTTMCLWKVPDEPEDRSETKDAEAQRKVVKTVLPEYHTRAMKHGFATKYGTIAGSKAILRELYRDLTMDQSAPASKSQRDVDQRVVEFVASRGDIDLWPDLRALNGGGGLQKYDWFWGEAQVIVDSLRGEASDRHGAARMAQLVSVRDLVDWGGQRMREQLHLDANDRPELFPSPPPADDEALEHYIPSARWVAFQFLPTHPHSNVATRHTGRFQLKRKIEARTLRKFHADVWWCMSLDKKTKAWLHQLDGALRRELETTGVAWSATHLSPAQFLSDDDKSKIPCGEPGHAVSTSVRPHHGALAHADVEHALSDHSWHRASITITAAICSNVPARVDGSWRAGTLSFTLKDSVLEPSMAARHMTERHQLMAELSEDDPSCAPSVFYRKTDGGPDQNMNNFSVILADVAFFLATNADVLVHGRLAPDWSFQNEVEGTMPIANLALYGTTTERAEMESRFEGLLKNDASMKKIRSRLAAIEDQDEQKEARLAWATSMAAPISDLKERFRHLEYDGKKALIRSAATTAEVETFMDAIKKIDPTWDPTMTTRNAVSKCTALLNFLDNHTLRHKYQLIVFKCRKADCPYHGAVRMPVQLYDEFIGKEPAKSRPIPFPMYGETKNRFDTYEALRRRTGGTTDKDMPTYQPPKKASKEARAKDKNKPKLIFASKNTRHRLLCSECGKPRVVYSLKKPREADATRLENYCKEREEDYRCGEELFEHEDLRAGVYFVRAALVCCTPVEKAYFSDSTPFHPCCAICGCEDRADFVDLTSDEWKRRLDGRRGRPICATCVDEGLAPATYGRSAAKAGNERARGPRRGAARQANELFDESDDDDEEEEEEEEGEEGEEEDLTSSDDDDEDVIDLTRDAGGVDSGGTSCAQWTCSYGASCKAKDDAVALKSCVFCGKEQLHHVCFTTHGELGGVAEETGLHLCFGCAVAVGIVEKLVKASKFKDAFSAIQWSPSTPQSPFALAAAMHSGTVTLWEQNTNKMCETCNLETDTDEVLLLHCSFCNKTYHNSAECLHDEGHVLTSIAAASDLEWACPICWTETTKSKRKENLGLSRECRRRTKRARSTASRSPRRLQLLSSFSSPFSSPFSSTALLSAEISRSPLYNSLSFLHHPAPYSHSLSSSLLLRPFFSCLFSYLLFSRLCFLTSSLEGSIVPRSATLEYLLLSRAPSARRLSIAAN